MSNASAFASSTVVLTGANRGIGLALAKALLQRGATVHAGVRQPQQAEALHALAKDSPGTLTVHALDVTDEMSVVAFVDALPQGEVDLLINNAGVNLDHGTDVTNVPSEVLMKSFDCNTVGPLRLIQRLLPSLHKSARPKVANISSIMGSIADNGQGGVVAYRASKTALNMVTKCLALADERTVYLTMHPGWVQTRMGGERAPVEPDASAEGLLKQIAAAGPRDSGTFLRFDGKVAPW